MSGYPFSIARWRLVDRPDLRLVGSLFASLILHLAIVADTGGLHWLLSATPDSPMEPLEVYLAPVLNDQPIPALTRQRRSLEQPSAPSRTVERASIPEAPPAIESEVSGDPPAVPVEPTLEAPLVVEQPVREAQRLPATGKLVYQFYWGRDHWLAGHAIHEWIVKDGYYTLSSTVRTTGLFALLHPTRLVETAQGHVIGRRLRPLFFSTQFNERPPHLANFNWKKGYFRWYRGEIASTQALPADSYDKISFLYQLYLADEKDRWSSAHVTTGSGLVRYDIENLGAAELEIDGRTFPTTHLRKIASSADSSVVEVWLSTSYHLPIKIAYSTPAGDYFEQVIAPESMPGD